KSREFDPPGLDRPPEPPSWEDGPGEPPIFRRHGEQKTGERFMSKPELLPQTLSLFEQMDKNGYYFAIWSQRGTALKGSSNAPADVPFPERTGGDTRLHTRTRGLFREAFHFTERDDCILAGRTITADLKAINRFGWWMAAAGAAVLAIGLGGGWVLASRALRPVHDISAAASRIAEGNL